MLQSAAVAALVALLMVEPGGAEASQPSTYDYDLTTPGVQGPTSPLFASPFRRFTRDVLNVSVLVPTVQLQAVLPSGFTALATADPSLASISVLASFQAMDGLPHEIGPYHTLQILVAARNTNLSPSRVEILSLDNQRSTQESVDDENQTFGGSRLAEFEWEISEERGVLHVGVNVVADGHSLHVTASGSAVVNQRVTQNPNPSAFRVVSAGVAGSAFFVSSQFDRRLVPNTGANVMAKDGRIELPGGASLEIRGVGTATFQKSQEVWLAWE
jgi:hypothetical protein